MALPHLITPACVGLGEESTYASAVSRTRWLRPSAVSLAASIDQASVDDLSAEVDSFAPLLQYQAAETVGGSVSGMAAYQDRALMILLKHALGSLTTSGGGPTYLHTYKPSKTLPTGLTVECGYADKAEIFAGCKVDRLELVAEMGRPLSFSATLIGAAGANLSATPTPSFDLAANANLMLHNHVGQITINSASYSIKRLRIVIGNRLQRRPGLGSLTTLEPVRSGMPEYLIECDLERTSEVLHDLYRARTISDIVIAVTDGGSQTLTTTVHNSPIRTYTTGREGHVITESLGFVGHRDSSDLGFLLTLVNSRSAL